jgi:hypothetical protein
MKTMTMVWRMALVGVGSLALTPGADGQGWVTLPNGELGYILDYTTTGFFECGDPFFMIGTCHASGNTITLGSAAATLTLTFQGLSQSVTSTNVARSVKIGTVTKQFGGTGPFRFPTSTNANVPLFFFAIEITTSNPLAAAGRWHSGYLPLSRTVIPRSCCDYSNTWIPFPVVPPPAGFTYGAVYFDNIVGTTLTVEADPMQLTGTTGIVPEPGTLWLTATGLAGVLTCAARLRQGKRRRGPGASSDPNR